jgi:hypothetical protein
VRTSVETLADNLIQRWPDLTPVQQRQIEALLRVNRRPVCGSTTGYVQHIERREKPCDPCRQAHADAQRKYMQRRRQRQRQADAA